MRAVVITRHGRAACLEVRDVPPPAVAAGEVRIAVRAAGLNFADVSARQGLHPEAPRPPAVVGYEVAGTIDAVGDGVTAWRPGDRVWALCRFGGQAELVCTPCELVRRMPDGMAFVDAAAVPVAYATALLLVSDYGHLRAGERVLIHMAAGGVGLAALDLCRRVPDVTIFGTASVGKHAALSERGLDHAIDRTTHDYEREVLRLTGGLGVHLILDAMGGRNWRKSYRVLAPLGRLMLFGLANATRPGRRSLPLVVSQLLRAPRWSPMTLMGDNRAVMGLNLGHLFGEREVIRRTLDDLAARLDRGELRPAIDQVLPFARAADAHRRIEDRLNFGKVILVPTV